MNWFGEIVLPSFKILFYLFGGVGVLVGLLLFSSPDLMVKIERLLGRKAPFLKKGSEPLAESLDKSRDVEYFFFNHHILTGSILIGLPLSLFFLLFSMPDLEVNPVKEFQTPNWVLVAKVILYPTLIILVKVVSCFSLLFGFFIIGLPQYAFRVWRRLNKNYNTDELSKAVNQDIAMNEIFFRYPKTCGVLIAASSGILLALLTIWWP